MSTDADREPAPDAQLRAAFFANSAEGVRSAIIAGANPDTAFNGMPLVYLAALQADFETLDLLIARRADLNARNALGWTTAMVLAWVGSNQSQMRALQRLVDAGADLSLKTAQGLTALDLSRNSANEPAIDILTNARAPTGRRITPKRDDGWGRG